MAIRPGGDLVSVAKVDLPVVDAQAGAAESLANTALPILISGTPPFRCNDLNRADGLHAAGSGTPVGGLRTRHPSEHLPDSTSRQRTPRPCSCPEPSAMLPHDAACKLLFSFPVMVRDLLAGFVPREWAEELDLSTLERWPESAVSDDLRQRYQDRVWRVRCRDRWLYWPPASGTQSGGGADSAGAQSQSRGCGGGGRGIGGVAVGAGARGVEAGVRGVDAASACAGAAAWDGVAGDGGLERGWDHVV